LLYKIDNKPSTANVLKKAKFFVSSGFSLVNSDPRDWGSDSPVNDELSTLKPWAFITRMSAGTRSPNLTSTRSPTTNSSAFKFRFSPLRIANASYKHKKKKTQFCFIFLFNTYRWHPKNNNKTDWKFPFLL